VAMHEIRKLESASCLRSSGRKKLRELGRTLIECCELALYEVHDAVLSTASNSTERDRPQKRSGRVESPERVRSRLMSFACGCVVPVISFLRVACESFLSSVDWSV